MAWLKGKYYYRPKREGGKVISEYMGTGFYADLAAEQDKQEQARTKAKRELFLRQAAEQDEIDTMVDMVSGAYDALVDAVLLVNGYRQHKRSEWRLRRDTGSKGQSAEGSEGTTGLN